MNNSSSPFNNVFLFSTLCADSLNFRTFTTYLVVGLLHCLPLTQDAAKFNNSCNTTHIHGSFRLSVDIYDHDTSPRENLHISKLLYYWRSSLVPSLHDRCSCMPWIKIRETGDEATDDLLANLGAHRYKITLYYWHYIICPHPCALIYNKKIWYFIRIIWNHNCGSHTLNSPLSWCCQWLIFIVLYLPLYLLPAPNTQTCQHDGGGVFGLLSALAVKTGLEGGAVLMSLSFLSSVAFSHTHV